MTPGEKKVLGIALAGMVGLVILLDVGLYLHGGLEWTISWFLYTSSKDYPVLAFAWGFVSGHLFWQMTRKP